MNIIKHYIVLFFLLQFMSLSIGQNFIANHSFEQYDSCSNYVGNIPLAMFFTSGNMGSPDYFHTCNNGPVAIPSNFAGYQYASDGIAFSGIAIGKAADYRESFQGVFTEILENGKYYCFEMDLSVGTSTAFRINELSVFFTSDSIESDDYYHNNFPLIPQINFDLSLFDDTSGWVRFQSVFLASADMKYFLISNFKQNLNWIDFNSNFIHPDTTAYYFIDNLSVTECPTPPDVFIPPSIPNVITPDGNGTNEAFFIGNLPPKSRFSVYSRWGNLVYASTDYQNDWEGTSGNGERLHEDTYYYILQTPDGKTYSSFFSLMRCLK